MFWKLKFGVLVTICKTSLQWNLDLVSQIAQTTQHPPVSPSAPGVPWSLILRCCAGTDGWTVGWCRRSRQTRSGRCWRWAVGQVVSAQAVCAWRTCRNSPLLCRTAKVKKRQKDNIRLEASPQPPHRADPSLPAWPYLWMKPHWVDMFVFLPFIWQGYF